MQRSFPQIFISDQRKVCRYFNSANYSRISFMQTNEHMTLEYICSNQFFRGNLIEEIVKLPFIYIYIYPCAKGTLLLLHSYSLHVTKKLKLYKQNFLIGHHLIMCSLDSLCRCDDLICRRNDLLCCQNFFLSMSLRRRIMHGSVCTEAYNRYHLLH